MTLRFGFLALALVISLPGVGADIDPADAHLKSLLAEQKQLLENIKGANDKRKAWNEHQSEVKLAIVKLLPQLERVAGKNGFLKEFADARLSALKALSDLEQKNDIAGIQDFDAFIDRFAKGMTEAATVKNQAADLQKSYAGVAKDPKRADNVTLVTKDGKITPTFNSKPEISSTGTAAVEAKLREVETVRKSCPSRTDLRVGLDPILNERAEIDAFLAKEGNARKSAAQADIKELDQKNAHLRNWVKGNLAKVFPLKVQYALRIGVDKKDDEKLLDGIFDRMADEMLLRPDYDLKKFSQIMNDTKAAYNKYSEPAYELKDVREIRGSIRANMIRKVFYEYGIAEEMPMAFKNLPPGLIPNQETLLPSVASFLKAQAKEKGQVFKLPIPPRGLLQPEENQEFTGIRFEIAAHDFSQWNVDHFNNVMNMPDARKSYQAYAKSIRNASMEIAQIDAKIARRNAISAQLAKFDACDKQLADADNELINIRSRSAKWLAPELSGSKGLTHDDLPKLDKVKEAYEAAKKARP